MNIKERKQDITQKIDLKSLDLEKIKQKQDLIVMEGKILDNIVVRMKKDELFHKNYNRIKEEQLKQKDR